MAILGDIVRGLPFGIGAAANLVPRGTNANLGQSVSGVLNSLPGNNLWSSQRPLTQALTGFIAPPVRAESYTPQVLGSSNQQNSTPVPGSAFSSPAPLAAANSPAGGGVGTKPVGLPQNFPTYAQNLPSGPDTGMFDAIIQPALQALEGGVGAAQSAFDAAVQQANAQGTAARGKAQANTQENINALNQRQTSEENQTTNAVNEARRGYSEIAQGIQAKYGGTTGTGAFANEILGSRTQGNIAGFQQQLQGSLQQIGQAREHVNLVGQQALQDIDNETQNRIANAKAQLDDAVNQIRMKQGELQSRKAEMVANAVQNFQQLVAHANQLDTEFKQQLYMQQQAAEQRLQAAQSAQIQKINSLKALQLSPNENLAIFNPNTGSVDYPQTGQNMGYSISPKSKSNQDQSPEDNILNDYQSLQ